MEQGFDFKKILSRVFNSWYYILIAFLLSVGLSVYLYYSTMPSYLIGARLLISGNQDGSSAVSQAAGALPEVMLGQKSNFDNQLIILSSYKQIEKAIRQLDFTVSYFEYDRLRVFEIYKSSPFKVVVDTTTVGLKNLEFEMEFISKDEFILKSKKEGYDRVHRFFEKIATPRFVFTVVPINEKTEKGDYMQKKYRFHINKIETLVARYQSKVHAERLNSNASVVQLTLTDNNISKGTDFLNKLCQVSVSYTLEKKNLIANNTIKFINAQLVGVSDSLSVAERVLENFRSKNEVMDVSMQGQMIIQQSQELENQRVALLARIDYLKYLYNYIQGDRSVMDVMSPLAMGINDPVLSQLLSELTSINAEKSSMQFNSRVDNPNLIRLDHRLSSLKNSIMENTRSAIESSTRSLEELNTRIMRLSTEIRQLPKTEQLLVGIERRFRMNDQMYTFLMERRSEAELAKASNMPDNEVLEEAMLVGQTAPNRNRLFLVVLVFGLITPFVVVFLVVVSNNKVVDKEDLTAITQVPIIGTIPVIKGGDACAYIRKKPKSVFSESMRAIRTNLDFYNHTKGNQTILLTSSLPYEGKSFTGIGLSQMFHLLDKRTILIDLDLRKMSTSRQLGVPLNKPGLSNLLSKDDGLSLADIIIHLEDGFDLLPGGTLPPNPMELISRPMLNSVMRVLKDNYDIVLIDTPPVGLVSDAHLLFQYCDVTLLMVRHDYTPLPVLKQVLSGTHVANQKNLNIILNGIPLSEKALNYKYAYVKDYYLER